jgi:hypothetical protein
MDKPEAEKRGKLSLMKREYHEGPEALERFEKGMTALFRAPKPGSKAAKKKAVLKPAKSRKVSTARGDAQS